MSRNEGQPGVALPAQPPVVLLDEIREKLWLYTVFVFAVADGRPRYSGTATCVASNGSSYLLTAAHVWRALGGRRVAVALEADRLPIPIETEVLDATVVFGNGPGEWGPDLALIRIPDLIATEMRGLKAFYDLRRARPDPTPIEGCEQAVLWGVIGAPAEQARFAEEEALMQLSLFDSWEAQISEREGLDYVELGFNYERRPQLPRSFRGVSGSGLWQIPMMLCAQRNEIGWPNRRVRLAGVAFYETFPAPHQGLIRCHGPISLREQILRNIV